jgi:predicted RNase H-like HicB family nuclease
VPELAGLHQPGPDQGRGNLEGFLVQADTIEEVIALAPGVAKALVEAMQEKGVNPALEAEELQFPVKVEVLVV